jgi:aspartyl-tRNA(Asn)/glutamyl-tRNA(Gln) amidotransferase subunit B
VTALAKLIQMEAGGALTSTQTKQVLADMVVGDGVDPEAIAAARGFEAVDTSSLETLVDDAIAAQPEAWEKYRAGEDKAVGALVGAVMKASQGQADGKAVTAILRSRRG